MINHDVPRFYTMDTRRIHRPLKWDPLALLALHESANECVEWNNNLTMKTKQLCAISIIEKIMVKVFYGCLCWSAFIIINSEGIETGKCTLHKHTHFHYNGTANELFAPFTMYFVKCKIKT